MTNKFAASSRIFGLSLAVLLSLAGCDSFKGADARVDAAEKMLAEGAYNEAAVELRNALDDDPKNARALLGMARTQYQLGLLEEAATAATAAAEAGAPAADVEQLRLKILMARGKHQELLAALDADPAKLPAAVRDELRVRALASANRCDSALPQARALVAANAKNSPARIVIAECLARRANVPGAVRELDAAVAADSRDANAWLALGRLRQSSGDRAGAEAAWLKAVEVAGGQLTVPQQAMMFAGLGDLQGERGDIAALRATHKSLIEVSADSVIAELLQTQISMLEGKGEVAVATLQRLMTSNPEFGGARVHLVSALVMQGSLEQARKQLSELQTGNAAANSNFKVAGEVLAKMNPAESGTDEYWARVAAIQAALGQPSMSRLALEKAVAIAPESRDAALALARLDLRLGATDQAADRLAALADKHPDDAEVVLSLGTAQGMQGKHADAAATFEKLYSRAPTAPLALALHAARQRGGLGDANAPLEKWLAANGNDASVRMAYAESLRVAGDPRGAAAQYEQVLSLQPKNVGAQNNLAWVYYLAKDPRAVPTARRAREMAPDSIAVADTYGWLLVESGELPEGLKILEQADAAAGQAHADIRYHHAAALARSGDKARARALLDDVLSNAGDFPSRQDAAALLENLGRT